MAEQHGLIEQVADASLKLSQLYEKSGNSILACAIFHGSMEIAFTSDPSHPMVAQNSGIILSIFAAILLVSLTVRQKPKVNFR